MTTLSDRPHTALVVIDVQNGVVAEAHERDAVVANISTLVDRARDEGVPVVWVQHSDERAWRRGVTPGSTSRSWPARNPSRWCTRRSATPSRPPTSRTCWPRPAVGRLVVAGAQTDACIRSTIHGAFAAATT